jgi:hypothetical protein
VITNSIADIRAARGLSVFGKTEAEADSQNEHGRKAGWGTGHLALLFFWI